MHVFNITARTRLMNSTLAVVPLRVFTTEFQRCLIVSSGTGHLEVVSCCKRHCLLLTWQVYNGVTTLQRCLAVSSGTCTLKLPVAVSAVVCYYGNAAIFKDNNNAAYNDTMHDLSIVILNPVSADQSSSSTSLLIKPAGT